MCIVLMVELASLYPFIKGTRGSVHRRYSSKQTGVTRCQQTGVTRCHVVVTNIFPPDYTQQKLVLFVLISSLPALRTHVRLTHYRGIGICSFFKERLKNVV